MNALHQKVLNENRLPVPTSHNMCVDDNLIADIKSCMIQATSSSIEVIFIIMKALEPLQKSQVFIWKSL